MTAPARNQADMGRGQWHTLALDIDRTNKGGNWEGENLAWRIDGNRVFSLDGEMTRGSQTALWNAVIRAGKFILLTLLSLSEGKCLIMWRTRIRSRRRQMKRRAG